MKTGRIFWGLILVYIGAIFLLQNFSVIEFNWRALWKLWPVLLIMWGANMLLSKESRHSTLIMGLITFFGLGLFTFFGIKESNERQRRWGFNFREMQDGRDSYETSKIHYSEEYSDNIKTAKLEIKGGAGDFDLKGTTDKLFEAAVESGGVNYMLRRSDQDSSVYLSFVHKEKSNVVFPSDRFHDTKIYLNGNPLWDIDLKVGAADVDFDLSQIKVKQLNLSGGAADLEVKLGSLVDKLDVKAETGVSSVKIEVPKSVGCRIVNKSGLSSKSFADFAETGKGVYESGNYKSATKHIYIELKSGISDLEVKTY